MGYHAQHRYLRERQGPRHIGDVVEQLDVDRIEQVEGRGQCRAQDDGSHHPQRLEFGLLQDDDQHDGDHTDTDGRPVELERAQDGVDGTEHPARPIGFISAEVLKLAEDDVHPDGVDEPDHHRVGDEPEQEPELEQPRSQHDHSSENGQGPQGAVGILPGVHRRNVGNDDRHRARCLHGHERRTGCKATNEGSHHVAIQAPHRVDARK